MTAKKNRTDGTYINEAISGLGRPPKLTRVSDTAGFKQRHGAVQQSAVGKGGKPMGKKTAGGKSVPQDVRGGTGANSWQKPLEKNTK